MTTETSNHESETAGSKSSTRHVTGSPLATGKPACSRRRARDVHGANIIRFSYAFGAFLLFAGGLLAMGWGITLENRLLAVTGLVAALAGGTMYGRCLFDE